MTATFAEVRTAVADAMSSVPGVNVHPYPVDSIDGPTAMVMGFSTVETAYGAGAWDTSLEVFVVVSRRHVDQLATLDALVDPTGDGSLVAAINAHDPDDGISLSVQSIGDYRELTIGDVPHFAATLQVKAYH